MINGQWGLKYLNGKSYFLLIFEHTCAYARWAHMHRFLSVCPSVCDWTKIHWTIIHDLTKIHISGSSSVQALSCVRLKPEQSGFVITFSNLLICRPFADGLTSFNSTSSCIFRHKSYFLFIFRANLTS